MPLLGAKLQRRPPQRVARAHGCPGVQEQDDDGDVIGAKVEDRRVQRGDALQLSRSSDAREAV